MHQIQVTRDSVSAGDDIDAPHLKVVQLERSSKVSKLLSELVREKYLATVSGGKATWLAKVNGNPIAVVAQQWIKPKFLFDSSTMPLPNRIHFTYLAQQDPKAVLKRQSQ